MTEQTYIITEAQLLLIEEKIQDVAWNTGGWSTSLLVIDNICDEIRGLHNIDVHNHAEEGDRSLINKGEQNQSQSED